MKPAAEILVAVFSMAFGAGMAWAKASGKVEKMNRDLNAVANMFRTHILDELVREERSEVRARLADTLKGKK